MTVQEFRQKASNIDQFIIFYEGKFHEATIDFDNYIITNFYFYTDNYRIICTLDVVEPQV